MRRVRAFAAEQTSTAGTVPVNVVLFWLVHDVQTAALEVRLKEEGALMLIPGSAVESMGMGGMLGAAALQQQRLAGITPKERSHDPQS